MKYHQLLLPAFILILFFSCKTNSNRDYGFIEGFEFNERLEYGYVDVPEDHDNPSGKMIEIAWAKIRPANGSANKSPIIFLTGGPGENTLDYLPYMVEFADSLEREVIMYDQRGIGYSSGLPNFASLIPEILGSDYNQKEELEVIKDVLKEYADSCKTEGIGLHHYNSFQNARDAGVIMQHLGYKKYSLVGGSYGTRLARVIIDMFPEWIESAVLDSPALFENDFIQPRIKSYAQALNLVFQHCESDPSCSRKYPGLRDDYWEGVQALEDRPLEIDLGTGSFILNPQDAIYLIRYQLYRADAIEAAPLLIRGIKNRDTNIVKEKLEAILPMMSSGNFTMFLATERFEFYDKKIDDQHLQTLYNEYGHFPAPLGLIHSLYLAASDWFEIEADPSKRQFFDTEVPALIYVNKYDPVTPPSNGYAMVEQMKNGYLFVLDEGGHGQGNPICKLAVTKAFLNNPKQVPDSGCLNVVNM